MQRLVIIRLGGGEVNGERDGLSYGGNGLDKEGDRMGEEQDDSSNEEDSLDDRGDSRVKNGMV